MLRTIKKLVLLLTFIPIFAAAPAVALQLNDLSNREGMVANFDPANLGPVLGELGLSAEVLTLTNGRTVIGARTSTGTPLVLYPSACLDNQKTNCIGLRAMMLFSGPMPSLQAISNFNSSFPFTTAGLLEDGYFISRYDIADYGIPRGNVESSLKNFLNAASLFREQMQKDRYVAGLVPETSASGYPHVSTAPPSEETDQTDATFDLVKALLSDPNIDRAKITNIVSD